MITRLCSRCTLLKLKIFLCLTVVVLHVLGFIFRRIYIPATVEVGAGKLAPGFIAALNALFTLQAL